MRLRTLLNKVGLGGASRHDISPVLAEAYYLASELTIKAREAERRIQRLKDEDR